MVNIFVPDFRFAGDQLREMAERENELNENSINYSVNHYEHNRGVSHEIMIDPKYKETVAFFNDFCGDDESHCNHKTSSGFCLLFYKDLADTVNKMGGVSHERCKECISIF